MGYRVSCPHFVGRAEELDLLGATFEAMVAGRAAAVLIGGDAGIGKSRLTDELCERARASGALVATGMCVPIEGGGLPFAPVIGILRDLACTLDEDGPDVGGFADELGKTTLFESILAFFTRVADRLPLVAVFEDLQWADSASAELLTFLTRNLADARVLLLGTYRSEELGPDHHLRPWLSELARHRRVTTIRLDALNRDETADLLAGILGYQPDWALIDAVWARSEGNPFFAEELTAARDSPSIPLELRGVILTRVEGLSKSTQQLLRTVAAAGAGVEHRLLATLGTFDADTLEAALAEAVDRQLLVVDSAGWGYRFRHELLRETLEASLLPGERARLHRQLAAVLAADPSLGPGGPGHRAAELAGHWWAAGEWAEALDASIAAANAAIAVWAFTEAFAQLERALAALDRLAGAAVASSVDRLDLLEQASEVAYLAGAGPRSVELARVALEHAGAAGDTPRMARCYTTLGRNAWGIGQADISFDAYERAAALLPVDPPSSELANVLAEQARGLMLMSRFADAERRCHDALAVARSVSARGEEGHVLNTLGTCRGALGHHDEGIDLLRNALAIAQELGRPDDLDRAYTNLSFLLVAAGRLEEGAAVVFDSLASGERLGLLTTNGAASNSADALIRLGRYDDADALLAQMGDHGIGICFTAPQLVPVPMAIRRGRFDEAHRLLAEADELTAPLADMQTRGLFHVLAAELALEQGRPHDAYEDAEHALALAAGTDDEILLPETCALAIRALADGLEAAGVRGWRIEGDKARLLADALVQDAARAVAAPAERGGRCAPSQRAFAAMAAAERARLNTADPELWDEAAALWEIAGEPYPLAYCRWRQADALLATRGERTRVRDCLGAAWRISVQLGASPLSERVERLARRARIPLDNQVHLAGNGATVASDLGLTPREVEVLRQLAHGYTDRQIADELFISKKTASVHVSNLLRKLDATNRVEAGRIGQALGLG